MGIHIPCRGVYMSETQTQELLSRLAKIEGHIRAIRQMVETGRSCPEVLLQIAVRFAVHSTKWRRFC